jgi:hypothetical protein
MYVWSKHLVIGLLGVFILLEILFWAAASGGGDSQLSLRTTHWIALNYFLLLIWLFVWMYDQARVRGKNVWVWLIPFIIAPLPSLVAYVLILQRRRR